MDRARGLLCPSRQGSGAPMSQRTGLRGFYVTEDGEQAAVLISGEGGRYRKELKQKVR